MSIILSLFIIGVSLSMDTFSISLSIGTFNINKHKIIFLSSLVGIMHFLMPFLGSILGIKIINFLHVKVNILLGIILIFIAFQMISDLIKEEQEHFSLTIINMFIIAVSVSLDSFSTGLGLQAITNDIFLAGIIFSINAFSFTFLGLLIGKYSSNKIGIYANILGIILLLFLGIFHIFG